MPEKRLYSLPGMPHRMLSSTQLREGLKDGLLLTGWKETHLKSATYNMPLGAFSCWYEEIAKKDGKGL